MADGIDLSILVCGVHTRVDTFLPRIQKQLYDQYEALPEVDQARVEIIVLTDNKKMMLGEKRNLMVDMAQGRYTVFVDDDDRVADDYVASLLGATATDADVITFLAEVTLNGGESKICDYSRRHMRDRNTADRYLRIPNHICCVKRSVGQRSSFPAIAYGEDAGYAKVLLRHLRTEHRIDRILYFYDYDASTTETQQQNAPVRRRRRSKGDPVVDVVILSKASTRALRKMTQAAVDSCIAGANSLPVNITVVEGHRGVSYTDCTTRVRTDDFHFNRFANDALSAGSAEWVMVANNDLEFTNGWLHALLAAERPVVSPRSPRDNRQADVTVNESGYVNGRHFSGWCFMMRRDVWEEIGHLSEDVSFWCSDDVVVDQLEAAGIEPMLVADSIVNHLVSKTLRSESRGQRDDLTWRQVAAYNEVNGRDLFADNAQFAAWKRLHVETPPALGTPPVFVVVAHPSRLGRAEKLAAAIGATVHVDADSQGVGWNHRTVLEMHAADEGHLVVIEDDAVPSVDFRATVERWIAQHPDDLLSFYLGTGKPSSWQHRIEMKLKAAESLGRNRVKLAQLLHGVCYAIPRSQIQTVLFNMRNDRFGVDMAIGDAWVRRVARSVIYPIPSLVEHLDENSLCSSKPSISPRRAWRPPASTMTL